jgi:hypothetical protein
VSSAWSKKLTRWWDYDHNGVVHSLAHVRPFKFITTLPATEKYLACTVEIRVGFSCHTFTRVPASGDCGVKPYLVRNGETRMFCPHRHVLSKELPDIIRGLPRRTDCFYAGQQNYFVVNLPAQLAPTDEYRVFFNFKPIDDPDAVLLFVQSAYAARKGTGPSGITGKKVGFRALLVQVLEKQQPIPCAAAAAQPAPVAATGVEARRA